MITKTHIYDMDGTIVCSMHRYRTQFVNGKITIDFQHWLDNQHRAAEDSLLPLAEQYKRDIKSKNIFVIIATARVLNEPDYQFILDRLGSPDAIVSRSEGDKTSGGLMKINGLKKVFNAANLWHTEKRFWEDNLKYLTTVCNTLGIRGHYVKSNQGW
jgi:hypothetical protein